MTEIKGMRTWQFPEVKAKTPGPWTDEPDKAQWVDEATGLDCLIVRAETSGSLCGYVGVPPGHPCYGESHYNINCRYDLYAHGGINYANLCDAGTEDGYGICHIPEPGRPAEVWWLGFDTGHAFDETPKRDEDLAELGLSLSGIYEELPEALQRRYRTFDYVQGVVTALAKQLAEIK